MRKEDLIESLKDDLFKIDCEITYTLNGENTAQEVLALMKAKRVTVKSLIELGAFKEEEG